MANEAQSQTKCLINKQIGRSDFMIGNYVTGGAFGSVHLGINTKTQEKVAIKLEHQDIKLPQLILEYGFYRKLGSATFIPTIFYFGAVGKYTALVMKLLGPSLSEVHIKLNRKFSIVCIINITIQLLTIYEHIHKQGLIYRDTKPENFLFGQPNSDEWSKLFLVDLGLCKGFIEEKGGHIEMKKGKPWTGTRRYISINNHESNEISRRDDLEAMIYMIVFLNKGQLPWQGVQGNNDFEIYKRIGEMKKEINPADLCAEMPGVYAEMLDTARKMPFEQAVDYRYFIGKLRYELIRLGISWNNDSTLDFDEAHNPLPDIY